MAKRNKKVNKISKIYMDEYAASVNKKPNPAPSGACMYENFENLGVSPYAVITRDNRKPVFSETPYSQCIDKTNFTVKYTK